MSHFKDTGFLFINNLADTAGYYSMVKRVIELGRAKDDTQVLGSKTLYKDPFFEKLLEHLQPKVEALTGYELFKTYSFVRQYHLGEVLKKHTDRSACEITVSLCLGYESAPWPISVMDKQGQAHTFNPLPGDAVIFKGIELPHWREENIYGDYCAVFLHYVDKHGPYADQKDDQQKGNTALKPY